MLKTPLALLLGLTGLLGAALFWRNTAKYKRKSLLWRLIKSSIDCVLILTTAFYLPALLIGWCVMWATKPFENNVVRVTFAVVISSVFGVVSTTALEVLMVISIWAVDMVTGNDGFGKNWAKAEAAEQRRLAARQAFA